MNCFRASRLLSSYIDGELPGVEQMEIRDHLKTCDRCGAEHQDLLTLKRRLGQMHACEPATGLDEQILARVHAAAPAQAMGRMRPAWRIVSRLDWRTSLQFGAVAAFGCASTAMVMYVRGGAVHATAVAAAPHSAATQAAARPMAPVGELMFVHDGTVRQGGGGGPVLDPVTDRVQASGTPSETIPEFRRP